MIKRFQAYIENSDWEKSLQDDFDKITKYLVVLALLGGGSIIAVGLWNIWKAQG